ncbi:extracellular solute-binding protein [Aliiroseovarius sp. 2305UL8-7]|uniref:extracellular solute-binding protein n=1 Tax=Aliiroseovarius conchicola TaxID=3121637 RepID=UPI0035295E12
MSSSTFPKLRMLIGAAVLTLSVAQTGHAEPKHGIAMYGEPALPADFTSLPHVNADAPKGGKIVFAEAGGFDSLHPYIRKGKTPWQLRFMLAESLMGRSWDEPFTLYGLLAETVETDDDRTWVEFTLRPEAKFSDGTPVTVDDVMWSYETLGTKGHGRYQGFWNAVASMEQTGPHSVKFTFKEPNRELALLAGLRPILKKAQWGGKDFEKSGVDVLPITSGPYTIGDFEPGRYLTLTRNPDYWGKDVPFMRGQANLDEIRFDYYGDSGVTFEAFKAGEANTYREFNAQKWATQYDFPAVKSGDVVLSEIPHQRPAGLWGYVMNTRSPQFADLRVRDAMINAFNFEFINQTINDGDRKRIQSYFDNSVLGMEVGAPAEGKVRALLEPFAADLPTGALEGYALPISDGSERNRAGLRKAMALMEEAGWTVQDGVMKNAAGEPFTFEIVLQQGADETRQTMDIFVAALDRMGITPTITSIDSAQYKERTRAFDYDMTYIERGASLSPGNEQAFNWGSAAADEPGSRNLMGAKSPAIDAMIEAIPNAQNQEDFRAATKALDRLLMAGRYVIPIWYRDVSWVAHAKELHFPERIPMYGDYLGFQPEIWWYEE